MSERPKEKIKSFVRGQDLFGHPINLNFDRHGETFNTYIGGTCSILLKILLVIYVSFNFLKMYNSNGDEKSNNMGLLELDHKIDIHDTHTMMF
jgi:hypothetical protein